MAPRAITIEIAIIGMPTVCSTRLTGCWWLSEYCAIHSCIGRPPSIGASYRKSSNALRLFGP